MTGRPRPGEVALRGVVAAHARISARDHLVADRRALYRLAVELVGLRPPPDHVLDDPAVRFAVGEVLAARRPAAGLRLVPAVPDARHPGTAVAAAPETACALAPALEAVAHECGGPAPGLILAGDTRHTRAAAQVRAGHAHARALVPELVADLEGHVAVIGILDPERSGPVVSASSRGMPGVILLRPGGPLEVAESLVHEAAHQRLFDMALTRDMLRADADDTGDFRPSWRGRAWPREQTLAAFHAYACLAELWRAVPDDPPPALAPHSVLPVAAARARELGEWLFARPDLLGADADRLVSALLGRPEPLGSAPAAWAPARHYRVGELAVVATEGGRCLVGVAGPVPKLFWLDPDATTVLGILQHGGELPAGEILRRYAHRCGPGDPFPPVSRALETLVLSELATAV